MILRGRKGFSETVRRNNTAEKLAGGLLYLLFSTEELASGNCSKPTRSGHTATGSQQIVGDKM